MDKVVLEQKQKKQKELSVTEPKVPRLPCAGVSAATAPTPAADGDTQVPAMQQPRQGHSSNATQHTHSAYKGDKSSGRLQGGVI